MNTTLKLKRTLCKIASQLKVKAGWNIYLIRIETGQHVSNMITFSSLREYYKCQAIPPLNSRRSVFLISDEREIVNGFSGMRGIIAVYVAWKTHPSFVRLCRLILFNEICGSVFLPSPGCRTNRISYRDIWKPASKSKN